MNLLVTGAGSLIGHGVLRSLRLIKNRQFKIFTADPDFRAAGHWLGNHALKIPMARDENYLEALKRIINDHAIDIVFVGTDPELQKISPFLDQLKTIVVISKPAAIELGEDKLKTAEFLKIHSLPFPTTVLFEDKAALESLVEQQGFPLIAKPRIGARSMGVTKIERATDFSNVNGDGNYIIQEHLPDEHGEYTAGTMTFDGRCISQVIFRRDLKEGNTYRSYSYQNKEHEQFLQSVSEMIPGVYGPLNFQYRIKNGKPVIFEINPRFSGTTPHRSIIGINEVEMAIDYALTGKVTKPIRKAGEVVILRTWSDIVVPIEELNDFSRNHFLQSPGADYFPFMN